MSNHKIHTNFHPEILSRSMVIYGCLTAFLSILFGLMYSLTPIYGDDTVFLENSRGTHGSWEYFTSTIATVWDHWQWDAGRFSNMAATPFLALFPKAVYAICSSFAIWIIYNAGPSLIGNNRFSYSSTFWIAVITFIFPWVDFMFGVMFSINYVWASALGLSTVYILIQAEGKASFSTIGSIGIFLLGFFTGWWHEGLSVPLIISIAAYFIVTKRKPKKSSVAIILGICCGIIVLLSMPAFRNSLSFRVSVLHKPVWRDTILSFSFISLLPIYALALLLFFLRKNIHNCISQASYRKKFAYLVALMVFGIIGGCIFLKYYTGPRVGTFVQLSSALGLMAIGQMSKTPRPLNRSRLRSVTMITIFTLSVINLCASISTQNILNKEYTEVKALLIQANSTESDFIYFTPTPRKLGLDLFKANYKTLNTVESLWTVIGTKHLLPKELEDFSPQSNLLLQTTDSSLFIYKNKYILLAGEQPSDDVIFILTTPEGKQISTGADFIPLKTAGNDCCWNYVKTKFSTFAGPIPVIDVKKFSR